MGFWQSIKQALSGTPTPAALLAQPIIKEQPLNDQFQRIGGGITPADVSLYVRQADAGNPARLIDLTNESRQKDGHLQSVCGTRDMAVALVDLAFVEPPDATPLERQAVELCRQIVADFDGFSTLIEHLTGSYIWGHATAGLEWRQADGLVLPHKATLIQPRRFIFNRDDGALRYRVSRYDTVGVDLLAENPGRIIQLQRRIVGDVPAREGLMRVLIWGALLRNWALRDWVALAEIGWKPWRLGKYTPNAAQKDIDGLVQALEEIGSSGVGAFPDNCDINITWPTGQSQGGTKSNHRELYETLGRELSKAVLGVTTSVEPGENGDRAGVEARDRIRTDIREADARAVAAALYSHMFAPAVAVNLGVNVRVPVPWFQTEEAEDRVQFAAAIEKLVNAGLSVPAKWVRDEIGMPEPAKDEEILGPEFQADGDDDDDDEDNDDDNDEDNDEGAKGIAAESPRSNQPGQDYADRLRKHLVPRGVDGLRPTADGLVEAVEGATSFDDAYERVTQLYEGIEPPVGLAVATEAAMVLAALGGRLEVEDEHQSSAQE